MAAATYESRPFLRIREGYLHVLDAGRRKPMIHGLVEVDVTEARRRLRAARDAGTDLSFTAFVIHTVARAVSEDRLLHAYRQRRRLVMFDAVDVNTQVEVELNGQRAVRAVIVRAAQCKDVAQVSAEIRAAQHEPAKTDFYRGSLAFLVLPRPVRKAVLRTVMSRPRVIKRLGGTVGLSAVGMFGGSGGWGVPIAPTTLMVTVGGIAVRPRYVDGRIVPRDVLDLTVSVDHAIVDGAPAARFTRRLTELLEEASGLPA